MRRASATLGGYREMRVSFRHADFDALTELWNRVHPEKYRIDREILELNTVQNPLFDWGASQVELDDDLKACGFVVIKSSPFRLYPGPDRDVSYLSAAVSEDNRCCVDLLTHAKAVLRERGVYRLHFGGDWRHFFPGCPLDIPRLKDLLIVEGFDEGGDQHDVQRDISDYAPPSGVQLSDSVRRLEMSDAPALDTFLEREFPGRWRFDTLKKIEEEGRADFIFGLWNEGELHGFALTQDASHLAPGCGAVWRNSLGDDWCCLGPIGVSESVRGKGLGDALLGSALDAMRREGKRNCLIDWTGLLDWYGKHGFRPVNSYLSFSLQLDL